MGARGPAPKDPAVRQRRNRDEGARRLVDGNPLPAGEVPELKARKDKDGEEIPWNRVSVDYWRELWTSPTATEYTRADVYRVWLYLDIFDRYVETRSMEVLAELRLQGAALGITPMDRRRLHWTISRDSGPEGKPSKPERRPRPASPVAVLRPVSDDA